MNDVQTLAKWRELETLYGADANEGTLPADGPAFHVWKVGGSS